MTEIAQRISMKAVIVNKDGKVLILRKAGTQGDAVRRGKYNMPGGRVEVGENFKDALLREIKEETGLEVEVKRPIFAGEWHPEVDGVPHQIIGMFFVCVAQGDDVTLNEEHDHYEWVDPKDRKKFDILDPEWEAIDLFRKYKIEYLG